MRVLATKSDVQNFICDISPHVKSIKVVEEFDGEYCNGVIITIKLKFWYGLFFANTFQNFIDPKIQERKLISLDYKVIVL